MKQPKYEVILSSKADSMLIEHVSFLAKVIKKAANNLIKAFQSSFQAIQENPKRFPFADQIDVASIPINTYRKCLFLKRYKVLYLVDGHKDAIIDARQENPDI